MPWPELDIVTWRKALKRLKPRAARGPGLPDVYVSALLSLLTEVEQGLRPWPAQLLRGLICSLDKQSGRCDAQGFRPICLFSVIYRTWAGIRARQALQFIEHVLPEGLWIFKGPGSRAGVDDVGIKH